MFFQRVLKALNKGKVKYVVAGGVAAIFHGVGRYTSDLDIIVDMSSDNIDKLFKTMKRIGFSAKVPVTADEFKVPQNRKKWIKEKNMKVFSFVNLNNPTELVDIFVIQPISYENAQIDVIKEKNLKVPVLSVKNLIKLKSQAGRDQDLMDISDLKRLKRLKK